MVQGESSESQLLGTGQKADGTPSFREALARRSVGKPIRCGEVRVAPGFPGTQPGAALGAPATSRWPDSPPCPCSGTSLSPCRPGVAPQPCLEVGAHGRETSPLQPRSLLCEMGMEVAGQLCLIRSAPRPQLLVGMHPFVCAFNKSRAPAACQATCLGDRAASKSYKNPALGDLMGHSGRQVMKKRKDYFL